MAKEKKDKKDKDDLPKEWIPTSLREPAPTPVDKVVYICAYLNRDKYKRVGYGNFTGSSVSIYDTLEHVPEYTQSDSNPSFPCIIRVNLDGTRDELYTWDTDRWVRVGK